jgi:hypothetical protein
VANTYFDRREKREKPVPNCGAAGLVWDEETQRCERKGLIRVGRELPATARTFPFEHGQSRGLGFLGPAVAAGSVAGPIGAVVGAVVGGLATLFGFGGGDDQATTYRPPANAAQLCVSFNDARGAENVAYDMSSAGIARAIANGNRDVDLYSYYSAFASGRTDMGASPAARRVIEDAARNNGVSISRAADMILQVAGVARIACASGFLPGSGSGSTAGGLPGYCPPGTYHPYPIGDPRANECAPFPTSTLAAEVARQMEIQRQRQQQQQTAQRQPTTGQRPTGTQAGATGVRPPAGYYYNPATGRYEPLPPGSQSSSSLFGSGDSNLWLWLLLAAAGIYVISDSGDSRRARR